jgi:hypothetical protein
LKRLYESVDSLVLGIVNRQTPIPKKILRGKRHRAALESRLCSIDRSTTCRLQRYRMRLAFRRCKEGRVEASKKAITIPVRHGLLTETDILLAGPSNAGLADPGQAAAISLVQICSALLPLQLTFDNLVALKTMSELEGDVGEAFIKAHQQLVEDEEKLRAV